MNRSLCILSMHGVYSPFLTNRHTTIMKTLITYILLIVAFTIPVEAQDKSEYIPPENLLIYMGDYLADQLNGILIDEMILDAGTPARKYKLNYISDYTFTSVVNRFIREHSDVHSVGPFEKADNGSVCRMFKVDDMEDPNLYYVACYSDKAETLVIGYTSIP